MSPPVTSLPRQWREVARAWALGATCPHSSSRSHQVGLAEPGRPTGTATNTLIQAGATAPMLRDGWFAAIPPSLAPSSWKASKALAHNLDADSHCRVKRGSAGCTVVPSLVLPPFNLAWSDDGSSGHIGPSLACCAWFVPDCKCECNHKPQGYTCMTCLPHTV